MAQVKIGSVVSPQLGWIIALGTLVRKMSSSRPLVERWIHGLKYMTAPTSAEVDELVAPHPLGDRANQKDLDDHERKRLNNIDQLLDSRQKNFMWSVLDPEVPCSRLVLSPEAETLLVMLYFAMLAWIGTSAWECARGFEPTYHAVLTAASVLFLSVYSMVQPMNLVSFDRLELKIAASFGIVSAATAFFSMATVYMNSPVAFPVFGKAPVLDVDSGVVLSGPPAAFLDLGASLKAGMLDAAGRVGEGVGVGASVATMYADGPIFFLCLAISLVLGGLVTLLFLPALRVGRCYSDLLAASETSVTASNDVIRALTRYAYKQSLVLFQYAPIFLAGLWTRFASTVMVSPSLVRCSTADVSRDCTPDGTYVGNFAALKRFVMGEPHLGDARTIMGESDWLRLRLLCVLLYGVAWFALARPFLQQYLRTPKAPITDLLFQAAQNKGAKVKANSSKDIKSAVSGERSRKSGFGDADLAHIREQCAIACQRPMVSVTVVLLQLFAVPALLVTLCALALRLSGMSAGVCDAFQLALPALSSRLKSQYPPRPEALVQLAQMVLTTMTGRDVAADVAAGRQAIYILAPAFWRPVLSFAIPFLLFWLFIMLELAFIYWRYLFVGAAEAARQAALDKGKEDKEQGKDDGKDKKKNK